MFDETYIHITIVFLKYTSRAGKNCRLVDNIGAIWSGPLQPLLPALYTRIKVFRYLFIALVVHNFILHCQQILLGIHVTITLGNMQD